MGVLATILRRLRALGGAPARHLTSGGDRETGRARRRAARLEVTLEKFRAKWARDEESLRRENDALSRQVLSPDLVRELLPLRRQTLAARAVYADAVRYDRQLQEASPAYRDALAAADTPRPDLTTTDVQGFVWSVPVPATLTGPARDRFVAKQRFPYRAITHTREFSVGPILLDIGANVGRMSIPRVVLGDVGRAYCAEPDPLNFAALVRNVAANGLRGLVLPDQTAIGSVTGPVRLRRAKYPGGHSITTEARPDRDTVEVPCWTLDDWCDRLAIDPALVTYVKVDTQGWEPHVLRGASRLLKHPHIAWQIEIQTSLRESGSPDTELYALCAEHFTHFVDLDKVATGPRVRRTEELPETLTYLIGRKKPTDIILFNAGGTLDRPAGQQALLDADDDPGG